MDPNKALADLREAIEDWNSGSALGWRDTANRAVRAAEALDQWMSNGGFLPDAWSTRKRS